MESKIVVIAGVVYKVSYEEASSEDCICCPLGGIDGGCGTRLTKIFGEHRETCTFSHEYVFSRYNGNGNDAEVVIFLNKD